MKRFLLGLLLACAPVLAHAGQLNIVTPSYVLYCETVSHNVKAVTMQCNVKRTNVSQVRDLSWRYGDAFPGVQFAAGSAGTGNSGASFTSPNSSIAIGGDPMGPTLDIALTQSQPGITFTQPLQVGTNSTGCTTANTTTSGVCGPANTGTTNIDGLVLGPQQDAWTGGTTASNSTQIKLCRNNGVANDCSGTILYNSGGTLTLSASSLVSTNGHNLTVGTGTLTATRLLTNSACSGTSPFSPAIDCITATVIGASSQAVWNFHTPYGTAPACHAQDQTTATALKVVTTTAAVTVTGLTGATDSVVIGCVN